jgi:predicted SnoaL-like aldol condensation-catalyzing enzyme
VDTKRVIFSATALLIGIAASGSLAHAGTVQEENKKVVTSFYELALNQHKPTEAARRYIGPPYTQHNPNVANGPEGFNKFIETMLKKNPNLKVTIAKVLADGDLVVLHVHLKTDDSDRGLAIAEFFRVENGKIVEHWDVVQPVPEKTASGNSMF